MSAPKRDATRGRPVKRATLHAEAYCLRMSESGEWFVVDNSAPSVIDDKPRMDVETLGPMGAMEAQAKARERWVTDRVKAHGGNPDDHVIVFMAATRKEAAELTGLKLSSTIRK